MAKIRLVSHADPRGSESYNEQLSRQRTNNAFAYLIRHGIAKNRLEQVWLGERSPKNKCRDGMDCTEEEYQENRQTEIQFGGKIRDREMPKLEVLSMDSTSNGRATSKEDIKLKLEPSGKEKIKQEAAPSGKEEIKESAAPAEQPSEDAKTVAPVEQPTAPADQPKEEAKTAAPIEQPTVPAEQPKEEAKTAAPVEQPKEEAKTAAPATTPATVPAEKEMVEELRKPENLIQDFDAPADSAKGGNAVPVNNGAGTAADGKPK